MLVSNVASAASGPDFNGDGFADLAIGTPFAGGSTGIVQITYGSSAGLLLGPISLLYVDLEGVPGNSKLGQQFGAALTWGDFNNDGLDDLVVGMPNRRVDQAERAGCVHIFPGNPGGLDDDNVQTWHQNKPGVPETAETGDLFGQSLASGDFNSDGFADLAVGVPKERVGFLAPGAGAVSLFYGSAGGVTATNSRVIAQGFSLTPGLASADDLFGYSLAIGDFNGDGDDDLAIGAPEDETGNLSPGTVTVLFGSLFGLTGVGAEIWQSSTIAFGAGPANQFGYSLAAGDIDDDGRDELVVGCPFDNTLRGRAVVMPGTALGLDGEAAYAMYPDETPGAKHLFGWAVALADFNQDGHADLAAGAPFFRVLENDRAGGVHILFGGESGLQDADREIWTQADIDDTGGALTDEWLGMALACGDFDNNGAADLVMASPFEDVAGKRDSGAVIILPGSATGFVPAMSQFWTQPTLGKPPGKDEAMGFSLMR